MRASKTKNSRTSFWLKLILLLMIATFASNGVLGLWVAMNVHVPVDRLLTNVRDYIKNHSDDAQGYYVLGRLHSLAFASDTDTIEVYQKDKQDLPGFIPWESIIVNRKAAGPLSEKARNHLLESVRNYKRAGELAPDQPMSFLGLGWMLESGAKYASQLGAPPGENNTTTNAALWTERALAAYRKAYELTIKADLNQSGFGPGADAAISLEAGKGIIRILEARRRTDAEVKELASVRESIAVLADKPRAITPIIFPLNRNAALDDLLATDKIVRFDMAGDGEPGWWPWVKPDTGILVWDPKRSGRVESGLQLFGSVTWWISWQHGYQPLAILDDNKDSSLGGNELEGLAVWRDRNSNGISEPGEVLPVKELGIERISVAASERINGTLCNTSGLQLSNGTVLPTYDWTPTEINHPTVSLYGLLFGGVGSSVIFISVSNLR